MKKPNFKKTGNAIKSFAGKNSTTIFAWVNVTCTVAAVATSIMGTKKAMEIIQAAEKQKGAPLTKKEKIKAVWTCYIWTVLTTGGAIAATFVNDRQVKKKISTLTTTLGATTAGYEALKKEVKDILGEDKYNEIREKITDKQTKEIAEKEGIPEDLKEHDGLLPCKDLQTKKWFRVDEEAVNDAKVAIAKKFYGTPFEMWVSLADLYFEMDVDPDDIGEMHNRMGWDSCPNILVRKEHFKDGSPYLTIDYDWTIRELADSCR